MKLQNIYNDNQSLAIASVSLDNELTTQTQIILIHDKLLAPPSDGILGPLTLGAIHNFQKLSGLPLINFIDKPLAKKLIETPATAIPEVLRIKPPDVFNEAIHFVLKWEGGYTDDPSDSGGETNYGIIHEEYDRYRDEKGLPRRNVRYIDISEVYDIYKRKYWDVICGDQLPRRLAIATLDFQINAGSRGSSTLQRAENDYRGDHHAQKALQTCLGVAIDGCIGPNTLAVLNLEMEAPNAEDYLLHDYFQIRENCYRTWGVGSQACFLDGWLNRLFDLKTYLHVT